MTEQEITDWVEREKEIERIEKQEAENKIKERILRNIPAEYLSNTFDSYMVTDAKQKMYKAQMQAAADCIISGGFITICLLGSYGIGKTHLSIAVMQELCRNMKLIEYNYTDKGGVKKEYFQQAFTMRYALTDEVRQKYEEAKNFRCRLSQEDIIDLYSNCDLLVLDEIGRSTSNALEKELIYKIINARDSKRESTILISNMSFKEFTSYVGGATMDRLKNSAIFPDLQNMASMRGKKND